MSKVTIRDIARIAGVSPATVSLVLNNKIGISEATRNRVLEVVQMAGFTPNVNSRRLSMKKSFNISIIMNNASSPFANLFYYEVAGGLMERSKKYGYNVVFTDIQIQAGQIVLPRIVEQFDTDGIVFFQDTDETVLQEIFQRGIPYVVVDAHKIYEAYDFTGIYTDNEKASYTATKYLIDNGHREIAFVGSSYQRDFYVQCFTGFIRALNENKLSIPSSWIQIDARDDLSAYACMTKIIQSGPLPTAVYCPGDIFAIGVSKCAKDHGLKLPEELSVIGFDNIIISRFCEPQLTTIGIDMVAMGTLAMDIIEKKIKGEPVTNTTVESSRIIIRESVRKID